MTKPISDAEFEEKPSTEPGRDAAAGITPAERKARFLKWWREHKAEEHHLTPEDLRRENLY